MKNKILLFTALTSLSNFATAEHAYAHLMPTAAHKNAQMQCAHLTPISSAIKHDLEAAKKFIGSVAEKGINFLSNEGLDEKAKTKEFEKLLSNSFDLKTIGRFTLGRYWRAANPKQREEFLSLFEDMVIDTYSQRFKDYKGEDLQIDGTQPAGKSDLVVRSFIVPPNGPKIQIDWRVRKKDGQYKIIDIIAEGVSMSLTQRSDFASVIQRGGGQVQVLIDHLKK